MVVMAMIGVGGSGGEGRHLYIFATYELRAHMRENCARSALAFASKLLTILIKLVFARIAHKCTHIHIEKEKIVNVYLCLLFQMANEQPIKIGCSDFSCSGDCCYDCNSQLHSDMLDSVNILCAACYPFLINPFYL